MKSQRAGLNFLSDDIKGDNHLTSLVRKLEGEGMNCGQITRVSDPTFSSLPNKVSCSDEVGLTLLIELFANSDMMTGGFRAKATDISQFGTLPSGNMVEFLEDVFVGGSKVLLPGHAKLSIKFDPESLEYTEYYLRKPLSTNSGRWIGYVINMMDYGMSNGHERIAKMIFPFQKTYSSKNSCYSNFERLFSEEPLLSRYPQTNDPYSSFIFGCIEK